MKKGDLVSVNVGAFTGSPLPWSLTHDSWHPAKLADGPNSAGQFYVVCMVPCGHTPMWVFPGYLKEAIPCDKN